MGTHGSYDIMSTYLRFTPANISVLCIPRMFRTRVGSCSGAWATNLGFDLGPCHCRRRLLGRHFFKGLISLFIIGVLLLASAVAEAASSSGNGSQAVKAQFTQEHPAAEFIKSKRGIKRVYGSAFEHGNSPETAAQHFVNTRSRMFGVESRELRAGSRAGHLQYTQPLMYDRQSGRYKFTMVAYSQFKQDLPVFRSDLRLLVRNEPDSPLVLAASSLRDLTGYTIAASMRSDLARPAFIHGRFEAARQTALARVPTLRNFSDPEVVVWAGVDDEKAGPAVALQFIADNHGAANAGRPEVWLFLADAITGEILYEEYLIRRVDVDGTVSGWSTTGIGADICEAEVLVPMPYARTNIGTTQAFAGADGAFTIPNGGNAVVSVESPVRGERFVVNNSAGSDTVLSTSVTPPGPADFVHNAGNSSEFVRAEINGYLQSNVVRDWIVMANPSYPLINNQVDFPVIVNRSGGLCPGNAWYDPSIDTINFCSAASQYPNTAWSSVVHHEFGHHLVDAGGSGQGEYGEGMGDVVSAIILDDPRLGLGFYGNCTGSLRSADNNLQYPCSGEIHYCGQLLAGSVWDTRNELVISGTAQYQQILMSLAVNSVLLHAGSSINPAITTDWLTLDDDNGDLSDGTPHSVEILAGFGAHNMVPPPPPVNDACTDAVPICPGATEIGSTTSAYSDGASSCGTSGNSPDAWYSYTPATSGSATFSLCGNGTTYDSVLSVHSGCPGSSANDLGCDDDACSAGGPSEVTMGVDAGATYLVRVTGWSGSSGDFELTVSGPNCSLGCTDAADCSDGDACNGSESCVGGTCQSGLPPDCDDDNACTTDSCSAGACIHDPLHCDDTDACTVDSCVDGACVNEPSSFCCGDLVCELGEDCDSCPDDCVGQDGADPGCGNGYCEPGSGEDCLSCPTDCRGKQNGKPGNRYCCGDGDGENPVGCEDSRCSGGGFLCSDILPGGYCCGDTDCDLGENSSNCVLDCGVCVPSTEDCTNGVDDDCDSVVDCADSDCSGDPACASSCSPSGASCSANDDCCSLRCKGKRGSKTCK